jgi:hypothetical protein
MRNIAAQWVLHSWSEIQMSEIAHVYVKHYAKEGYTFLGRIIALDETWAHRYKVELKWQSSKL